MMIKKIANGIREGIVFMVVSLFTLVAAPIIHQSGLDNVDRCPTPEDIENSQQFAEQLRSVGKQK